MDPRLVVFALYLGLSVTYCLSFVMSKSTGFISQFRRAGAGRVGVCDY